VNVLQAQGERREARIEGLELTMEARATSKYLRVSPQKARLVVNLVRGQNVNAALDTLRFTKKGVAREVLKILQSAIANAEQKSDSIDVDELVVSKAYVNEGPRMKRIRPAPMGRAYRYQRRMSHITLVVESPESQE
jgi:large subunit ribosomal protein L22